MLEYRINYLLCKLYTVLKNKRDGELMQMQEEEEVDIEAQSEIG